MDSFLQSLSRIGPIRLTAILGITAGVTIALVLMASSMGNAEKALLYTDLDFKDAGAITAKLDQMSLKYEIRAGGTAIFVDRDKVQTAKMALAAENLPNSGSIGYDVFDKTGAMGQTTFIQNINRLRALQGELERTVVTLDGVQAARVLLVLPDRQLFQTERENAKASVTIKLGASTLGARQTNAIRHLVAGAVPGLTSGAVTIVDDSGRVLAGGSEENTIDGLDSVDRRQSVEEALKRKISNVLASVVGVNGVEVQVQAEVEMNRITRRDVVYDPDGQVIISSDTSEQNSNEQDTNSNGQVTVSENIPGGNASGGNQPGSAAVSAATQETINYGVSKTETTTIIPSGAITRLSVAVNVDGATSLDAEGNEIYTPRSAEEMASIEALVKTAMGFDSLRKDQVQVTNLRFMRPKPFDVDGKASGGGFDKNDIMRLIELGILGIVSIVMMFFLGRPLISALTGSMGGKIVGGAPAMAGIGAAGGAMPQLPGASGGAGAEQMALPAPGGGVMAMDDDEGLDVSKIEGKVKASSVKKIASIVDSHPDESVSILRTWLHEA